MKVANVFRFQKETSCSKSEAFPSRFAINVLEVRCHFYAKDQEADSIFADEASLPSDVQQLTVWDECSN